MRELLHPDNRFQVQRSILGGSVYKGPAFFIDGMLVKQIHRWPDRRDAEVSGWEIPWDRDDVRPLDEAIALAETPQSNWVHPNSVHPNSVQHGEEPTT